jgi:hypothetical protein
LAGACSCRADPALNYKSKQIKTNGNEKENTIQDIGMYYKNARKAFRAQNQHQKNKKISPSKLNRAPEPRKRTIQDR